MKIRRRWIGFLMILVSAVVVRAGVQEGIRARDSGDFKKAYSEFLPLANEGDDKAMVTLGLFHYEGHGVPQDYSKALEWFLKAYEKDNADAFSNIGVMFRDGQGVPKNKKMAYCIFLITHVCSLGSESTQIRVNSCLRQIIPEMTKEELTECYNYTPAYIHKYILAKGALQGIPEDCRPSSEQPAIKDMPWWADGELDFLPEDQRPKPRPRLPVKYFTLRYQIKGLPGELKNGSVSAITDKGIGSGSLKKPVSTQDFFVVYEDTMLVSRDRWRYVALEPEKGRDVQVYVIRHPDEPEPCDWSAWQKPEFVEPDSMAVFGLCGGRRSSQAHTNVPANAPWMRFRVEARPDAP